MLKVVPLGYWLGSRIFVALFSKSFPPKNQLNTFLLSTECKVLLQAMLLEKNTVFALPQHVTLVALVMCALPASASVLDELISCVHYRILLCLDEDALCSTGTCCRSLCLGDFPGPRNDCGNIEIGGVFARFVQVS